MRSGRRSFPSVTTLACLMVLLLGCAAARPHVATDTGPKTPRRPLLLWRVSAPGAAPTYLFGTCHAGVTLDRGLPADHRAALDNARVVALEVDGSTVMDPQSTMSALLLPENQSLRALVGEDTWRELVRQMPNRAMHWMALDRFHPFLVAAVLTLSASGALQQEHRDDAMEPTIVRRSRARGVRLIGLETAEDQLRLVTSEPPSASVPGLRSVLEHPTETGTATRAMFYSCAWGADDLIASVAGAAPDALLTARNRAWMPRIETLVHDGGAFIAVGAAHMVGPTGLIALLTARGYRLERMVSSAEDDPGFALSIHGERSSASPAPSRQSASTSPSSSPSPTTASAAPGANAPEWVTGFFSETFANTICEFPAARTCIASEPSACAARYRLAVRWCADELASQLPAIPSQGEGGRIGGLLGACAQESLATIAHLRNDWRALPQCDSDPYWAAPSASPAVPPAEEGATGAPRRGSGRRGRGR